MAKEKKQFTELSDEELKQVTGGRWTGFPEECKDEQYKCSHPLECQTVCAAIAN